MIYTITLNPALDRALWVKNADYDVSNRVMDETNYAGGKGIDVSIALANLGIKNCAIGFLGGETGKMLENKLKEKGIITKFIKISEETRVNILINVQSTGKQIPLNFPGPHLDSCDLNKLKSLIKNELGSSCYDDQSRDISILARDTAIDAARSDRHVQTVNPPNVVTIGGSLPPGVQASAYTDIIEIAREKGATVILDADGEALKVGINAKPDIIKPNLEELRNFVGCRSLNQTKAIIKAARKIHNKDGIRIVLVSLGSRGIILVSDEGEYMAKIPYKVQAKAKYTIGAGDSAIAGFIYGIVHGMDHKESLICAAAAGTAATISLSKKKDFNKPLWQKNDFDESLCQKEDFDKLIPLIREHLKIYQDHSSGTCKPSSG